MGVIVGGQVLFAPGEIDRLREEMDTVIAATRTEPGCLHYSYARQLENPDRIIIFEHWEHGDALRAHFKTPHMAVWYEHLSTANVLERNVQVFPFDAPKQLRDYRDD
ncbi:MAG: putative quinol monooxygenase [Pseudomonadota bacterium]